MFSKTCEYAIRAVLFIASNSGKEQKVLLEQIAAAIDSPAAFTGKILQELARKKLISSTKGRGGGFYMDGKQLRTVKLSSVIMAFDGDSMFVGCALGLPECNEEKPCPLHNEFIKIRNQISSLLRVKITDLVGSETKNLLFLKR